MDDAANTEGTSGSEWHPTACVLCSINCGLEVRIDGPTIARVRGDKAHPGSQGYTCEKGLRIDHYQNGAHRLTSPLRRRPDGSFEEIDWDTAIAEVAARFADVISEHGGDKILFYGGGGQGNHLGGGYGGSTRAALGITYTSNALAQEKTGEFWVDGQLFGRSRCHTTGDYERAEVAVFWGKNPWQSHGFPQARKILKEIANDPARTLIVVDPRRTESADLADIHLRPRPGGDADLLAAMLAVLVEENLLADRWLADNATGLDEVVAHLRTVDIAASCDRAGVDEATVRRATRVIGAATGGVSIYEDLGIQMAPHSTLNSYLEKLIVLLTGNFGVPGGMNLHSHFTPLLGGGSGRPGDAERCTPVTGHRLVTGLVPCNVIPDEILGDHPDRFRAMLIESGNPVHSLADSRRMREALDALELVVVIDVALTETRAPCRLRAARGVAVREVGVHVLQPRVPAQRVPPPTTGLPATGRHVAGIRDPLPSVSGPGCIHRRRPCPAARRGANGPRRIRRGVLQHRRRATRACQVGSRVALRVVGPDAGDVRR